MARQVLPWVGAAVGFMVGGPVGAQAGFALGSLIGNAVDPIEVQGNKLGDSPTQTAAEGGARAIVFGKGCIRSTCVLERGGRRVIKQRDSSGGKGGSPTTVNERALWTYAIGLGEAIPGGAILRIWEDEKLVYDITPDSQIPADSAAFAQKFRFYDGSEDQLPDPAIEAIYSDPDDAPYYRGTAYVVFPQRDLTDFGERVPTYRFEVATATDSRMVSAYWARTGGIRTSPNGQSWDNWVINFLDINSVHLIAARDRVIIYGNSGSFRWTDDGGVTFHVSEGSGLPSLGGLMRGQCAPDGLTVMVACGVGGGCRLSTDGGLSFSTVGSPSNGCFQTLYLNGNWIGVEAARVYQGGSTGSTWTETFSPIGGVQFSCAWSNYSKAMIGGQKDGAPYVMSTGSGSAFSDDSLPAFVSATSVTAISGAIIDDEEVWVLGTNSGEIAYKVGGTWHLASDTAEHPVFDIAFNGRGFLLGSRESGSGAVETVMMYSESLSEWTETARETAFYSGNVSLVAFASVPKPNADLVPLADILAKLHELAGHSVSDFDTSDVTDEVVGVVIEQTTTAAEAINSIIGTHWLDPSEYDGKIRYIKRGKPVVKTLTADDLIDEPETWQRNNAIEYPAKVHFFGQIAESAYAPIKATHTRYSTEIRSQVVGEASVSSPETFNDSIRPHEIAAILHKIMWTEAGGEITWRVTDEHMDLVPSDCVGLSWRGQLARARIVQIEDDPGERKLKMRLDRQSAYTANLTEIPVPPAVTPPLTSIPADTALAVLDIPALIDSDDDLHLLTAMSGESDAWSGAALQRSTASGADFETIDSVSNNAIMGLLQEEVTAASPHFPDRTNAVVVELFTSDTIDSLTDEQWLSEGGAFALSWDDGGVQRWEILQYRDAEPLGGNTYRLTNLMRGRLDTEAAAHPVGAMFVLLDTTLRRHAMQSAWIGTDLTHRAVSNGQSPEDADEQTLTYEGNSQREWPVAHVFFQRDANGVLTATTVPRHRFGTEDNPIRSQNWSGYRWEVTDGTNTITREGTSESEVFDTLNWGDEITVTVWQLNRITGASDPVSTSGETPAPPTGDVLSLRNVWAYELQMSGVAPYGTAFPTKETPATISDTDLLFAFMDSSEEVVPLSGWTLVGEIESDAPSGARRLTVFVKDTVDPANDAGVSFPWETVTDSLANSIGYRAIQTSGASPGTVADVQSVKTTYSVAQTYPHTINFAPVTSGANGGLLLGFALTGWDGNTTAEGLTYPTGHVVVVVRRLNENDTSSQTAQFQAVRIPPPTPTSGTGYYASISVLLEP